MKKLNGYTQEQLATFKDWDIQYIPEWAFPYITGDLDYNNTDELYPEEINLIIDYECLMIKKGFEPSKFKVIKWDCDIYDEDLEFEIDPDPTPAFCTSPAFGLPCGVYRVLYIKLEE